MTPKSLLRNPMATSSLKDLSDGEFQLVIPEVDKVDPKKVDRIILCSGKVYYELLEQRRKSNLNNIAIIRVEQLYPFPEVDCRKVLAAYAGAKEIVWCQEEPQNQGAWNTMQFYLTSLLSKGQTLEYAGRASSASPAVGYHSIHEKEQAALVSQALSRGKSNGN
jgi:2-oxoglutarate dehydrogenase E1 component